MKRREKYIREKRKVDKRENSRVVKRRVKPSWHAQYLVMLEGDFCCSAHCNGRFVCAEDQT